eukprot:TRINITY_DN94618_c0_g1_i1.p1 TRINITY_DN94618_c0_g1~~TRINITY_DN94618_c0_g1_i1.p1  ORF type:complete len:427 (+),score=89.78 TRINITY_DN94618_c0_g1_i1:54-1334(+)
MVIAATRRTARPAAAQLCRRLAAPFSTSVFDGVQAAPADPILSLTTRFKEDPHPKKVNLGVGAYRTNDGKPWVLPSVLKAAQDVINDPGLDKEYAPIDGAAEFKAPVQQLVFSDETLKSGRVATSQCLSGTGGLSIIAQFMHQFLNVSKIHVPDPTWGNHPKIFQRAGLEVGTYSYYKPETRALDFEGMVADLEGLPKGTAVLLHSCAHNPTGVDPTPEQWEKVVETCRSRQLLPILDNAYQGYASGDLARDGHAQNLFEQSGLEFFLTQSFAKNFGLYGERIGYLHVLCNSKERADVVLSQLKILIRQAYSSPPRYGAKIVNTLLTQPELKEQWLGELKFMAERIGQMRLALRAAIEAKGTPGSWNHVTDQIGMFTYTGLSPAQVDRMVDEFHIYMTKDGRISMAGITTNNVDYVADAIYQVVTG